MAKSKQETDQMTLSMQSMVMEEQEQVAQQEINAIELE